MRNVKKYLICTSAKYFLIEINHLGTRARQSKSCYLLNGLFEWKTFLHEARKSNSKHFLFLDRNSISTFSPRKWPKYLWWRFEYACKKWSLFPIHFLKKLFQYACRRRRKEILVSYCIFLRKKSWLFKDDACHQISYKVKLGGYRWGEMGQKRAKRGVRKKFFLEKFPKGIKPFCKFFKNFA